MTAIILDCDALAQERRAASLVATFGKTRCVNADTLEATKRGVG